MLRLARVVAGVAVVAGLAAVSAVAPSAATNPSVTVSKHLVSGSPTSIDCAGSVDVEVDVTGTAGTAGNATDIVMVLDVSGSMAGSKFTDLKNAATAFVHALDARDGADDGSFGLGNRVALVTYRNTSATTVLPLGASESSLVSAIGSLSTPSGGSPHAAGIQQAQSILSASTNAKAIALFTDGLDSQSAGTSAATAAKGAGIRIATVGVGSDAASSVLQSWASQTSYYQSASTLDANKLVDDLGAAVAIDAPFQITETLGSKFTGTLVSASTGTVTPGPGTLVWSGSLKGGENATLVYHAKRNGDDVFAVTNEVVGTSALTGGMGTVTPPAAATIDVVPCGGQLLDKETCSGSSCSASGTQGGVQFTVNAGTPPAGTQVFLTGLDAKPPAGACPGFDLNTNGAQFDIRPLTTDGSFQITIPKSVLGTKKWWQTDVCIGTNLRFITAIGSLANLRPGATLVGGGTVPARWYGLLPSIPRFTFVSGLGFVPGPRITARLPGPNGSAIVQFNMPFIANSGPFTTDGLAAHDPKVWGG